MQIVRRFFGLGFVVFSSVSALQGIRLAGAWLQMKRLTGSGTHVHDTFIVLSHGGLTLTGWQIVAAAFACLTAALASAFLGLRLMLVHQ